MDEDWLNKNSDYIEILERILKFEDNNKKEDSVYCEKYDIDTYWDYSEVSAHPSRLHQLDVNGFIEKMVDTNSTTYYVLSNRDKVRQLLDSYQGSDGTRVELHDFPEDQEELDGVFDDVVGYDDVKFLIKRAMTTQRITNILLVGPSGSAKTVFLMAINELDDSVFVSGGPTSGPGVLDKMFNEVPKYMLIDEMDDMSAETQEVLSQYTETGILDETKIGKDRKLRTNTKTFGSANDLGNIKSHIENRFLDVHFDPYTREEFIEVCEHILPRNEGEDKESARHIAKSLWDIEGSADVRKAIQVARLSRGDSEKIIEVLDEYSSKAEYNLGGLR